MTVIIQSPYGGRYEYVCNYFTFDPEKGFLFQIDDRKPVCLDLDFVTSFEVVGSPVI